MNPVIEFYNLIFYKPVSEALLFFHQHLKDLGLALISLTILIRIFLLPLDYKNSKEQKKFLRIKKEIEEISKKFKGEQKTKEIVALYKKEKINPFFNLFSLLIQFPILISLYQVSLKATTQLNPYLFGFLDLSKPSFLLSTLAILLQTIYLKLISSQTAKETSAFLIQSRINFFLIPLTFLVLMKIPSAISLYLLVSYLFLTVQKLLFHV